MTPVDELRALVQRYSRAVDDRDISTLAGLFHPEAEIEGARGSQTLEVWLDGMRAPRSFPVSMHLIADPFIQLSDTGNEASIDSYAVVYQLNDEHPGAGDLTLGIRYLDEAVVYEGAWVFRRRLSRTLWMR
jgi:hypothetical protein